jgi:hypothetical protein
MNKSAMKFTRDIIENSRQKLCNNNNISYSNNNNNHVDPKECEPKTFMADFLKNNFEDKEIFDEVKTLLVAVSLKNILCIQN